MGDPADLVTLRWNEQADCLEVIDQTRLPHALEWRSLRSLPDYCTAIADMWVRGAPLIGITAAFGLAWQLREAATDDALESTYDQLLATRPTAVNLRWALETVRSEIATLPVTQRAVAAMACAHRLREEDINACSRIGDHGLSLFSEPQGRPLQLMTHCNAGWLATIQWGTALSPIYKAQAAGWDVHVWVSETRPRNQGASLTAWELGRAGVPHTVVTDNACGHLIATGQVDACIVGSDRTAANGDVCNKVGTYLKALACAASEVPFCVALPLSTIDWSCPDGAAIPIEERMATEVSNIAGINAAGTRESVSLTPPSSPAANPAFDVTPASLVRCLVTETGVYTTDAEGMARLRADAR